MHRQLSHPAEDGPTVLSPLHDHGEGAQAIVGSTQERRLALAAIETAGRSSPAVALLRDIARIALAWSPDHGPTVMPLPPMAPAERAILHRALGSGEVSGSIDEPETTFSEAVCPGIWLVRDRDGEHIEVGEIPRALEALSTALPLLSPPRPDHAPMGLMNALPVLAELAARSAAWRPGDANHVVSLTLLPMSPADLDFLAASLGDGAARIESGGYGFARIASTGHRGLWRVRFFNSMGTSIQDVIEVGDTPAAVRATAEDVRDGASRLAEIIEAYLA
jgi:hydrogenase-1 operon protein HyaF